MAKNRLVADHSEACTFPGVLDVRAVEDALRSYLKALGVDRRVSRLPADWHIATEPSLLRQMSATLDDFAQRRGVTTSAARAARDALDARAARDALDARDALAARAARAARAALDARAARAARDALDARDALAALAALDARAALDALAALAALAARAARDARDARDARAALAALDARDARDALDALAARDALAALAARDARAAREQTDSAQRGAALHRFAQWCVGWGGWGWWAWDLSYLSCTHIGAAQLGDENVQRWARPVYDAFLAGAWYIHFTDDTLYWVSKPHVHVEEVPNGRGRRLHSAETAAVESDIERLYFWHGVLVPAFVVVRPDWITAKHVQQEDNAEVRRIMIERMGAEKFITEVGAEREQADDYGELFRVKRDGDSDLVMVRVINSTPEPDGSFKRYMLRVPPQVQTAREGVAWTWGFEKASEYELAVQT